MVHGIKHFWITAKGFLSASGIYWLHAFQKWGWNQTFNTNVCHGSSNGLRAVFKISTLWKCSEESTEVNFGAKQSWWESDHLKFTNRKEKCGVTLWWSPLGSPNPWFWIKNPGSYVGCVIWKKLCNFPQIYFSVQWLYWHHIPSFDR